MTTSVTRFEAREIEPDRVVPLPVDHPALSEARTIFGKTVTASKDSPRFLISGHSNTKLGKTVMKGPLKGAAIYQLSLEERATCPTTCLQWASCYGNAMPFARRHTPDRDFERYLEAEVITLCRQHPEGLLIRLHVLGDFYSVEYVYLWARLIAEFPQLHVFGYTARTIYDPDPEGVRIARAIEALTDGAWDRFAIRTSSDLPDVADSRAIVVEEDPRLPGVIVCPTQTDDTAACATCGLCWSKGARDKTIAFLLHGRKLRGPGQPKPANDDAPKPRRQQTNYRGERSKADIARDAVLSALAEHAKPGGLTAKELQKLTGLEYAQVAHAASWLGRNNQAKWTYARGTSTKVLMPLTGEFADVTPVFSANQKAVLNLLRIATAKQNRGNGTAEIVRSKIAAAANVPLGSMGEVMDALVRKRAFEIVAKGDPITPAIIRLTETYQPTAEEAEAIRASHNEALSARAETPAAEASKPQVEPVSAPPVPVVNRAMKPVRSISLDEVGEAPAKAPARSLMARKPGQCAWPINDPRRGRMDETTYCCEPVVGRGQYCRAHFSQMFSGSRKSAPEARA